MECGACGGNVMMIITVISGVIGIFWMCDDIDKLIEISTHGTIREMFVFSKHIVSRKVSTK